MASFTFATDFPAGTTVQVFKRTRDVPDDAPPPGSAVTSAAVAADSTLTFTGLTPGRYWAYVLLGGRHRYVSFELAPTPTGPYTNVQNAGSALPGRPALDFEGVGLSTADDPDNARTVVTLTGAAGPAGPAGPAGAQGPPGTAPFVNAAQLGTVGLGDWGAIINTALASGVKRIVFPKGDYPVSTRINLNLSRNVIFEGEAAFQHNATSGNWAKPGEVPRLIWQGGAGSGCPFDLTSADGFVLRDMGLYHNSAAYDGLLLDFPKAAGSGWPANAHIFRNQIGFISGTPSARAAICVRKLISGTIEQNTIRGCLYGIRGADVPGEYAASGFGDNTRIVRNTFDFCPRGQIANVSNFWTIEQNEFLLGGFSGTQGGIYAVGTDLVDPPAGVAAAAVGTGGTFAAGTYFWKVTFVTAFGESNASSEVSAAIVLNGSASLSWTAPTTDVIAVKVYRATSAGAENVSPALVATLAGTATSYTDTGTATTAGAVAAADTVNSTFDFRDNQIWDFFDGTQNGVRNTIQNPWDVRIDSNMFWQQNHAPGKEVLLTGPGQIRIRDNHFERSVATGSLSPIDLGDYHTALKSLVLIAGNEWGHSGTGPDLVTNLAGHQDVRYEHNSFVTQYAVRSLLGYERLGYIGATTNYYPTIAAHAGQTLSTLSATGNNVCFVVSIKAGASASVAGPLVDITLNEAIGPILPGSPDRTVPHIYPLVNLTPFDESGGTDTGPASVACGAYTQVTNGVANAFTICTQNAIPANATVMFVCRPVIG